MWIDADRPLNCRWIAWYVGAMWMDAKLEIDRQNRCGLMKIGENLGVFHNPFSLSLNVYSYPVRAASTVR